MTLFTDEITALLAVAAGYDNRRPGELNTAAWHDASHRGRWTYEEAVEAVKTHYATKVEFVMPAHVTEIIKTQRRRARQDEYARQLIENPYNIKSFRDVWQKALSQSKEMTAWQKQIVFAYPDLKARLCEEPIGFKKPEFWNGWVPPEVDQHENPNSSRRAAALRALVAEARQRQETGQ